ncbi:hypothetical protein KF707_13495 [Candidatus Obscuribacterales bacterium]|nr:hypothetical protein [Candidatus Obscuribacterales bacterium]
MDLSDLAPQQKLTSDPAETKYSPQAADRVGVSHADTPLASGDGAGSFHADTPLATGDRADETQTETPTVWEISAREAWAPPQRNEQRKSTEAFDATPPESANSNTSENPLLAQTKSDKPAAPTPPGADNTENPRLAQTKSDKPASPAPRADLRTDNAELSKSLTWLEKAVELSDRTDTRSATTHLAQGQAASLDLIELLTNPTVGEGRREALAEMNLRIHAEKFQDYAKYLDPALARAELALAKISSGEDKQIAEGEKTLLEAVARRPELQVDAAFNRKILSAYHKMETSRKSSGLPAWDGEVKTTTPGGGTTDTTTIDAAMDKANEAYADTGIKAAIPHFETAIREADRLPQDKITEELTELFRKRIVIERSIIAKELREENVDKLLAEHKAAKETEWNKYREHLAPGSARINCGLAMIASGDAEMLKRGKAILTEAITKRPELEFSVDYANHLKKAFEAHHQNKPQPASPDGRSDKPAAPPDKPGEPLRNPLAPNQPGLQIPGLDSRNPTPPLPVAERERPGGEMKPASDSPNKPMDKFQVGYKKFETRDLGKAATDLEKDKKVVSYTSDVVTGPVLTAACLYLGYKVAKGRLEAIRARRAAAAGGSESNIATTESKTETGTVGKTKTEAGTASDTISKPGTASSDASPATAKPAAPSSDAPPGTAKPADSTSDFMPAVAKPKSAETDKLPMSERIKTASEEIQPGLKKLYKLARSPENRNKHYDRLVNDLIELDKTGKLDSTMKAYLKKEMVSFLDSDGVEALQDHVENMRPKTAQPTEAMQRPPISAEQRTTATDSAFNQANEAIRQYDQGAMTKDAKDYTNKILEKYFPGVEATEVFAGSEGLAVRLNDGTILKFRPNTEWDASWGHRQLDMPLLSIDSGEPRPMLIGPEGKQWIVYRQPFGETPDPAKVQDFIKAVKRAQGNTGDFGRAVDAASRQVGNYVTPDGRVEVRTFDYGALEIEIGGEHEFSEQDKLDLSKPRPSGSETNRAGSATETSRPGSQNAPSAIAEPPKSDAAKPDAPKPDASKLDAAKTDAPKPDASKPAAAKPDAPRPAPAKPDPLLRTTSGGNIDEIPIETSPFEQGSQAQPKVERPATAMEAGKMIEIALPGGIKARMAKADAPRFLDRVEKEFKTSDFGKVIDEMLSDKTRSDEEQKELRELKTRYEQLPPEAKEECKAEFFANLRTQLGLKTETTEAERGRTSRVGRTLAIGGGVLAIGILSSAVLRHMMQRDTSKYQDRIQVEFKKDK